jgi:hypothetical protein
MIRDVHHRSGFFPSGSGSRGKKKPPDPGSGSAPLPTVWYVIRTIFLIRLTVLMFKFGQKHAVSRGQGMKWTTKNLHPFEKFSIEMIRREAIIFLIH